MSEFQKALEQVNAGRFVRQQGYCEIPTEIFVAKIDVNMPPIPQVVFYTFESGRPVEIRKQGEAYSPLALSNHRTVWIREPEFGKLREYTEKLLTNPKSSVSHETRMESLRSSAMLVVDDIFKDPSPENIDRGMKAVSSFVYVLMKDPKAYLFLAKLSSHDPYTLQHSVGTAVLCIILARKMGIQDEQELKDVGMAGLLHDVGKVKVKTEIINKKGPLDEDEWEEMRQHSLEGYEIVKNNPSLSENTKRAILEHHEDKNGTGYPLALKAEETHLFSKIVCACDTFNALTTNRSYSKAMQPFDALKLMRDKLGHKIDETLFKQLVLIYGGRLEDL
jgi:putative nucleotidyltransferase with HDIG domain